MSRPDRPADAATSEPRVLIVDDDVSFAIVVAERLRVNGYAASISQTARHALEAASADPPDVFIVDVNMTPGDGFRFHDELQRVESLAERPVIFVSGEPVEWLKQAALAQGGRAFLRKPVEGKRLLGTIRRVLERDSGRPARETNPGTDPAADRAA